MMQHYFGMVKLIDRNVGKLIKFLKEDEDTWTFDNTIIVFTADHGDTLGVHVMRNKGVLYKSSAGIPFIISHPDKIKQGNIVETQYTTVDFSRPYLVLLVSQWTILISILMVWTFLMKFFFIRKVMIITANSKQQHNIFFDYYYYYYW